MAKSRPNSALSIPTAPQFETRAKRPLHDGLWPGIDGSMWLWRTVPMSSVSDARDSGKMVSVGAGLASAYEGLATLAGRGSHRNGTKSSYRDTQLLLINVPDTFHADPRSPIADHLNREHGEDPVLNRVLLFGVRLNASTGTGTIRSAVESVWETAVHGGSLLSDYEKDHRAVAGLLSRAGFAVPSTKTLLAADSWWNFGLAKGVPVLPHDEHIHFFHSALAARYAESIDAADCGVWPSDVGEHAVSFAAVEDFDLEFKPATDPIAQWAMPMMDAGARVISIRAKVEPAKVTRNELRSQKKRYTADLNELAQQGKADRAEIEEREARASSIERGYAQGGPATLHETSVVVGFSGVTDDIDKFAPPGITLSPMLNRQGTGWHETMACSAVRANPLLHDLPQTTVSYSGIPSLTRVGDADGALVGYTERDRQPSYLSPVAAAQEDTLPLLGCYAATGAGKLLPLDATIPTPTGTTTMGALRVGDAVLGRDGRPCTVKHLSGINQTPDLYRIRLSDGQVIEADADHQWIATTQHDRNAGRKADHLAAIERWSRMQEAADRIDKVAEGLSGEAEMTVVGIYDSIRDVPGVPWSTWDSMKSALQLMEIPSTVRRVTGPGTEVTSFSKRNFVRTYDVHTALTAAIHTWTNLAPAAAARWAQPAATRAKAAQRILERTPVGATGSAPDIERAFREEGAPVVERSVFQLLRDLDVPSDLTLTQVDMPGHRTKPISRERRVYPARLTLIALANRIRESTGAEAPTTEYTERVVTTAEMIAEGIDARADGAKNWAIRVSKPLDLPEAELSIAPYTLGAWLGDGTSNDGGFTGIDQEIWEQIESEGYVVSHRKEPKAHYIVGLVGGLRAEGVLNDKRIPAAYLRASYAQRLALLQGLMDTDGTISVGGGCELSLNKRDLAEDALELVRSLGIKASMTMTESAYVRDGVRKVTGTRHRIRFTTTVEVFRLARKTSRLPAELRETARWLYVESIEAIESRPGRCIQVDSVDSSYVTGGFVPTHNTLLLQFLADQFHRLSRPQVIVDPKQGSDLSMVVRALGGRVVSLDDFASQDGPLDPLRIFPSTADAITKATSMIARVNPYNDSRADTHMTDISYGIKWAVGNGAKATGQALQMAVDEGVLSKEMVEPIFRYAQVYPMFRATFGMHEGASALDLSDGLTYVKVGDTSFELPPMNATQSERIEPTIRNSMNVIRMLIWGSLASLRGRGGVIHFDESWVMEKAAAEDLDQVGRLARQWDVLPILYTQRPSGQLDVGLKGYISRGLIGHIKDPKEAAAALELFGIDNQTALVRITAERYDGDGGGLNWNSLQHLPAPSGGVLRGSVFYYSDLRNRFAAVEVKPSASFLAMASSNPDDVARRNRTAPPGEERAGVAQSEASPHLRSSQPA